MICCSHLRPLLPVNFQCNGRIKQLFFSLSSLCASHYSQLDTKHTVLEYIFYPCPFILDTKMLTASDENDEGPGKLLFAMPQHKNHAFLTKKLASLDTESTCTVQSSSQHTNAVLHQLSIPATMQPVVTTATRGQQQIVDYLSLSDALEGESVDDETSCDIADSTDSLLGRESLELASETEQDDDGVGSDTLFQLLGGQKDLEQRMNAIEEAQEQCSTFEQQQFNIPTVLRVMYMGACSEKDKRILFRKLSRALSTLFHDCPSFFIRNPHIFKERKHHLLLMSLLPEDEEEGEENMIETCEDNGLSIIEADFSWSTVSAEKDKLNHMITRYLSIQCEYAIQQDPWASSTTSHQQNENFDGFLYPERTPNGIDLCIYFYDGSSGTTDEDDRVEEDLIILWQLKKLGIPIIPILSSPSAMRRTSMRSPTSPLFNTRSVADRRTRLADMLAKYKIRCIDIALSSLDIGQHPSFQRRNNTHTTSTTTQSSLESRLGRDWAISSITAPAPYNILTVEQFAALDPQALFSILKQCRQKALRKEKLLQQITHSRDPTAVHPSSTTTTQPSPPSTSPVYTVSRQESTPVSSTSQSSFIAPRQNVFGLIMVVLCTALCISWFYSSRESEVWTASLSMTSNASSFVIELRGSSNMDHQHKVYEIAVPVSSACLESSTPVPLADIQFMHPPRIDLVQQQSYCQPDHTSSSTPSSQHSSHPDHLQHDSHWDQIRRTAAYFFGSPTKIIKTVFNREQH